MDQGKLNEILEKHALWLRDEPEGARADLYGVDLRGANLRGANLYGANLYGANLYEVDLRGANLRGANLYGADLYGANLYEVDLYEADLRGADLREANLREANLYGANLYGANLYGANLREVDLRGANLYEANLREVDLRGANLRGANLYEADLYGANLRGVDLYGAKNVPYIPMACPDTGEFIAWKKAYGEDDLPCLVKLRIPKDARRSSATGRKCRADKAVVLSIESIDAEAVAPKVVYSRYDTSFAYKVRQTIVVPNFDPDRFNECAPGIHFFINRQEAIEYHF